MSFPHAPLRRDRWRALVGLWACVAGSWAIAYVAASQLHTRLRFDVGSNDEAFLSAPDQFREPRTFEAPQRLPGGGIEIERIVGRLAGWRPAFRLPYHAVRGALRLKVRVHRFGLGGLVRARVNGADLESQAFGPDSYPWAPIEVEVPGEIAARGPLHVELWVSGGSGSSRLPAGAALGIDWLQVEPGPGGVYLVPTPGEWLGLVLLLGGVALLTPPVRPSARGLVALLSVVVLCLIVGLWRAPVPTRLLTADAWKIVAGLAAVQHAWLWLYRHRPDPALRLAVAGATSLLCLGGLELGVRAHDAWLARDAAAPEPLRLLTDNPHGTGSYRLKPNLDLETRVGGYRVHIRTNSHGMHWREVARRPEPGRRRVAFLGDSFTFGCWVPRVEQSFVGVFDALAAERGFEALNFGVGGYGVADAELLLREEGLGFEPRYVVLALFVGNDFRDTYLGVHKDRLVAGTAVLDEDVIAQKVPETYRVTDGAHPRPSRESSRVLRTLRGSAVFRRLAPLLRLEHLEMDFEVSREFVAYSFWQRTDAPPVMLSAVEQTLGAIDRLDALARRHGARLGVVTLPTRAQVYAREPTGPDYDVDRPQSFVRDHAEIRDLPYLDLLPPLRARAMQTNQALYVDGDTHLNVEGHRLVGEIVAEWFLGSLAADPEAGS